jgi:hypothetical protein
MSEHQSERQRAASAATINAAKPSEHDETKRACRAKTQQHGERQRAASAATINAAKPSEHNES